MSFCTNIICAGQQNLWSVSALWSTVSALWLPHCISENTGLMSTFSKLCITLNSYWNFFKCGPKLMYWHLLIYYYLLNVIVSPFSKYFSTEDHWIVTPSFNDIFFLSHRMLFYSPSPFCITQNDLVVFCKTP